MRWNEIIPYIFLKPVYRCSFLPIGFYRSTWTVAGMSILLIVCLLPVNWDSGRYGVPHFRCRPQVCVFSSQHDDTHGT